MQMKEEDVRKRLFKIDPSINWSNDNIRIKIVANEPYGLVFTGDLALVLWPSDDSHLDEFLVNLERTSWQFHIPTLRELPDIFNRALNEKMSFDIETNSLNPYLPGTKVVCFSVGFKDKAYAIPICEPFIDPDNGKKYEDFMLELVTHAKDVSMHFGVYDVSFLCHKYPKRLKSFEDVSYHFDTMTAAHVLTGAGLKDYKLQTVAHVFCKAPTWKGGPAEWLAETYRHKVERTYDRVPQYILIPYAKKDAFWTAQLHHELSDRLERESLMQTYRMVHDRIGHMCLKMHITGLNTDKFIMDHLSARYEVKQEQAEKAFKEVVRERVSAVFGEDPEAIEQYATEMNVDSNQQLSKLLFEVLGIPVLEKTVKTGEPKTGVKIMTKVASFDPELFSSLFIYKKWSKYIGYLQNYVTFSSLMAGDLESTRRICAHSTFSPIGTKTGRMNSSRPNAQNISIGSGLKAVFCCPDLAEHVNDIYEELRGMGMKTRVCEDHFKDMPVIVDDAVEEEEDEDGEE